jgi:hypothetical protein
MNFITKLLQSHKAKNSWHTNIDPESIRVINKDGQLQMEANGDKSEVQDYKIKSTAVKGFTWNPRTRSLFLTFTNGNKEYEYPDVPEDVVEDFENASSKGRFVNRVLKEYSTK